MILGFVAVGLVMFCFVPILVVTVRGPTATPDLNDHWHVAFGIYACDHFLEPLVDEDVDVHGIHTHGDGLVHIHPFDASVTGDRATLDVFARQVGLRELQRGGLQLSDGTTIDECEGRPVDVTILRWSPGSASGEPPTRSTAGFSDTRFEADREYITAAVLPVDVELSDEAAAQLQPPSVVGLDQISDQTGAGRTTSTPARVSTVPAVHPVQKRAASTAS